MENKGLIGITGASSGIGKATAKLFLEKGYSVLLMARRVEEMKGFEENPNALIAKTDVTKIAELEAAVQAGEAKFGPLQCMINNAGMMLLGDVAVQDSCEWEQMIQVNITGVLNGMKTALTTMKPRNTGTIINISSIAGKKAFPNHAAYVGTKFAVTGMTENVREEVAGQDIRVILICPGVVETALLSHTTDTQIRSDYQDWKTSINGGLGAEDIANAIAFAFEQPQSITIRDITLAPTRQLG